MIRRSSCAALAALSLTLVAPALAALKPTVRIAAFRVVLPDGRDPPPPLLRSKAYSYLVEYQIGGQGVLRVTRAATVISPAGVAARVRPPASSADPGRFRASARIRIGPDDPPGVYLLRYTIVARDPDGGVARRRRDLRVRFR